MEENLLAPVFPASIPWSKVAIKNNLHTRLYTIIGNINKIKEKLNEKQINYIIIEDNNTNKITFEGNRYNLYVNKRVDKRLYKEVKKSTFLS